MDQKERRIYLIEKLLQENTEQEPVSMLRENRKKIRGSMLQDDASVPQDEEEQKRLLRGLMNVRYPKKCDPAFLQIQDEYLKEEIAGKGITDCENLPPAAERLYIWQGDITTLRCDAIVNAANSGMTGCYVPNHRCIDNCIHTFAGVELRNACAGLMRRQGRPEPTGRAKITLAYNLPCQYVLHTVGPIVTGRVTPQHRAQLADCYRACMELAAAYQLESVAFCCISTGEFHFPNAEAAAIAVQTVTDCMQRPTSVKKVIFNVFKDTDRAIYEQLL